MPQKGKVWVCKLIRNAEAKQCFPNLSWRPTCPASFACLPYLTHPIPLINSLVETARTTLVSD